jgi:hypothetical protein
MINVLAGLQKELAALAYEKGVCCEMGEGFSLRRQELVARECSALKQAEEKLQEAASLIREGY